MVEGNIQGLNVQSVADALSESLRTRILQGDLPAGQKLTEARITSEYQVARTNAKAAIERLTAEGLLERDAHRSAQVATITPRRIRDIYFTRNVIESQAYRILARDREVPAAARAANQELAGATASDRSELVVDSDVRFHRALVDALGSERTTAAHMNLTNEMRLCMRQVQHHRLLGSDEIAEEHNAILAAIEGGQPELAARLGTDHLSRAEQILIANL
ncbi:GntR family transcriptional regulator [Nocardia sp. NPDC019395]|uniref:GntR family transcriptional regulator n=1 Tax=Nocardia sp. NPDC019395 TaxID=3154686 RepID=UPI0033D4826F